MQRISSESIFNQLQHVVRRFPLTILLIIISTLWELYLVDMFTFYPIQIVFTTGIILATASQLLYERFFRDKEKLYLRWLVYTGLIFFLILYYFYFSTTLDQVDGFWTIYSIPGIRAMIIYFLAVLLLAWIPSINSSIKFSDSFLVIFKGHFASSFFALILYLGIVAILFLFELLFFSLEGNWFSNTFIIVFNLFLPILFLTFIPDYQAEEITEPGIRATREAIKMPKFFHGLITYILIPIMAVYTLLLVFYILMNLTSFFFRDNLLEPLILAYAINGWTLLILSESIENKPANLFKRIFPFLLIFVFIFQIFATITEIQNIGITHGRYFILLFGVGSIISAFWYIRKEPRLLVLPIVSLISGIIALVPPIDAVSLSVNNQVQIVENILEENNILHNKEEIVQNPEVSILDQERLNSSLDYLRSIRALNQLSWLPEDYYRDTDTFFGFTEGYGEETIEDPIDDIEYYEISLADDTNLNLSVADYDYMLNMKLGSNETTTEAVLIQNEMYTVRFSLEEEFLIKLEDEEQNEVATFDFTYILDEFGKEDAFMPVEQLIFIEDDNEYTTTLLVKYLEVFEGDIMIEFILFL